MPPIRIGATNRLRMTDLLKRISRIAPESADALGAEPPVRAGVPDHLQDWLERSGVTEGLRRPTLEHTSIDPDPSGILPEMLRRRTHRSPDPTAEPGILDLAERLAARNPRSPLNEVLDPFFYEEGPERMPVRDGGALRARLQEALAVLQPERNERIGSSSTIDLGQRASRARFEAERAGDYVESKQLEERLDPELSITRNPRVPKGALQEYPAMKALADKQAAGPLEPIYGPEGKPNLDSLLSPELADRNPLDDIQSGRIRALLLRRDEFDPSQKEIELQGYLNDPDTGLPTDLPGGPLRLPIRGHRDLVDPELRTPGGIAAARAANPGAAIPGILPHQVIDVINASRETELRSAARAAGVEPRNLTGAERVKEPFPTHSGTVPQNDAWYKQVSAETGIPPIVLREMLDANPGAYRIVYPATGGKVPVVHAGTNTTGSWTGKFPVQKVDPVGDARRAIPASALAPSIPGVPHPAIGKLLASPEGMLRVQRVLSVADKTEIPTIHKDGPKGEGTEVSEGFEERIRQTPKTEQFLDTERLQDPTTLPLREDNERVQVRRSLYPRDPRALQRAGWQVLEPDKLIPIAEGQHLVAVHPQQQAAIITMLSGKMRRTPLSALPDSVRKRLEAEQAGSEAGAGLAEGLTVVVGMKGGISNIAYKVAKELGIPVRGRIFRDDVKKYPDLQEMPPYETRAGQVDRDMIDPKTGELIKGHPQKMRARFNIGESDGTLILTPYMRDGSPSHKRVGGQSLGGGTQQTWRQTLEAGKKAPAYNVWAGEKAVFDPKTKTWSVTYPPDSEWAHALEIADYLAANRIKALHVEGPRTGHLAWDGKNVQIAQAREARAEQVLRLAFQFAKEGAPKRPDGRVAPVHPRNRKIPGEAPHPKQQIYDFRGPDAQSPPFRVGVRKRFPDGDPARAPKPEPPTQPMPAHVKERLTEAAKSAVARLQAYHALGIGEPVALANLEEEAIRLVRAAGLDPGMVRKALTAQKPGAVVRGTPRDFREAREALPQRLPERNRLAIPGSDDIMATEQLPSARQKPIDPKSVSDKAGKSVRIALRDERMEGTPHEKSSSSPVRATELPGRTGGLPPAGARELPAKPMPDAARVKVPATAKPAAVREPSGRDAAKEALAEIRARMAMRDAWKKAGLLGVLGALGHSLTAEEESAALADPDGTIARLGGAKTAGLGKIDLSALSALKSAVSKILAGKAKVLREASVPDAATGLGPSPFDALEGKQTVGAKQPDPRDLRDKLRENLLDRHDPISLYQRLSGQETPENSIRDAMRVNVGGGPARALEHVERLRPIIADLDAKQLTGNLVRYLNAQSVMRAWDTADNTADLMRRAGALRMKNENTEAEKLLKQAEILRRNREAGTVAPGRLSRKDAQAALDELDAMPDADRAAVQTAADEIERARVALIDAWEAEGLKTADEARSLRARRGYVPIVYRDGVYSVDDDAFLIPQRSRAEHRAMLSQRDEKLVQEFRGAGPDKLVSENPLEAWMKYHQEGWNEVARNRAAKAATAGNAEMPEMRWDPKTQSGLKPLKPTEKPPAGYAVVSYMEKGETKRWGVPESWAKALEIGQPEDLSFAMRVLADFRKSVQSLMTTSNPLFLMRNVPRDLQDAVMLTPTLGRDDVVRFAQLWGQKVLELREAAPAMTPERQAFLRSGAHMSHWSAAIDPEAYLRGDAGLRSRNPIRKGLAKVRRANDITERATKESIYQLLKETNPDLPDQKIAAWTREFGGSPDFAVKGRLAEQLSNLVLFFNPAFQGSARTLRAYQKNPRLLMQHLAGMTAAASIAAGYNKAVRVKEITNENGEKIPVEGIEDIPESDRNTNLVLLLPGITETTRDGRVRQAAIRLPLGHAARMIYGPINDAIRAMSGESSVNVLETLANTGPATLVPGNLRVDPNAPLQSFGRSVIGSLNPAIKETVEQITNTNSLNGAPIVGRRMSQTPSEQYNERTSPAAIAAGRAIALPGESFLASPARIEHAIRGLTGGPGELALSAIDGLEKAATGDYAPVASFSERLTEVPLGALGRPYLEGPGSQKRADAADTFYGALQRSEGVLRDLTNMLRTDPARGQVMLKDPEVLAARQLHGPLLGIARRLSALSAEKKRLLAEQPGGLKAALQQLYLQERALLEEGAALAGR